MPMVVAHGQLPILQRALALKPTPCGAMPVLLAYHHAAVIRNLGAEAVQAPAEPPWFVP